MNLSFPLFDLALLFEKKGMPQNAARHFQLVVQGYTKLLGPEIPETVDASYILKCWTAARRDEIKVAWTGMMATVTVVMMMVVATVVAMMDAIIDTMTDTMIFLEVEI